MEPSEGVTENMIQAYVIFQLIALGALAFWIRMWSGKQTSWLQGRRRGWSALLFLLCFTWCQAVALSLVAFEVGDQSSALVDSDLVRLLTAALWLIGTPVVLIGMLVGWPRFLLPSWIRERLNAGDPVNTAHPIPEVQHLMTKPQNTVMNKPFDPSQYKDDS